jgi:hypothetical protein
MLVKVHSAAVLGIDAYPVEFEVNSGSGQPAVIIVGLPDAAVKESRDRVKTAIENNLEPLVFSKNEAYLFVGRRKLALQRGGRLD